MKSKKVFIVCTTGCSCCNDENHVRGPYATKEDADRRIDFWLNGDGFHPTASQFASRGRYHIDEVEVEEISEGRWIINDTVFKSAPEFLVPENGDIGDVDRFCSYYEW